MVQMKDSRWKCQHLLFSLPPSATSAKPLNSFVLRFFWNENGCCLCLRCEENLLVPAIHKKKGYLPWGLARSGHAWDTIHKVANESLVGDLPLLLAPSLGHFFINCRLLARHSSFETILFFFSPLSLRNYILKYYFAAEMLLITYA